MATKQDLENQKPVNPDKLQCPVCYGIVYPPIPHCPNGHSVCPDCYIEIEENKCPLCRERFYGSRSPDLENLYFNSQVLCKHQDDGCTVHGLGFIVLMHQASCDFGCRVCPRSGEGCQWRGPLTMLTKHFVENHLAK